MKRKFTPTQTCLAGSRPCSDKHPERFFFSIKAAGTALFLSIFLLVGASLHASAITSAATGNWSDGGTRVGGTAPVAGDDVIIASVHTVTLNRKIYRIDLQNAANPVSPTAAQVESYDAAPWLSRLCTNGVARPFALKFYQCKIHVGVVCIGENVVYPSGQPNRVADNLRAHVFEIDPSGTGAGPYTSTSQAPVFNNGVWSGTGITEFFFGSLILPDKAAIGMSWQ
jgi:hypothetical protein